jgi:outer membrane protein OmpA-like peptidoglycan-associated protein
MRIWFTLIILILQSCSELNYERKNNVNDVMILNTSGSFYLRNRKVIATKKTFFKKRVLLKSTRKKVLKVLVETVYFDFGKDISLNQSWIMEVAQKLKANKSLIEIVGYTDNIGSIKVNRALAFNRAVKVSVMLIRNGVKENRIFVKGKPLCCYGNKNQNRDEEAQNRRVEIYLH